jgi:hypothetical protein
MVARARRGVLGSATLVEVVLRRWVIMLAPYNVPVEMMSQGRNMKNNTQWRLWNSPALWL